MNRETPAANAANTATTDLTPATPTPKKRPFKKVYCDPQGRAILALPDPALKIWLCHYSHEGKVRESFPSLKTLRAECRMNRKTITKWRQWLVKHGWLEKIGERDCDGEYNVPVMKATEGTVPPRIERQKSVRRVNQKGKFEKGGMTKVWTGYTEGGMTKPWTGGYDQTLDTDRDQTLDAEVAPVEVAPKKIDIKGGDVCEKSNHERLHHDIPPHDSKGIPTGEPKIISNTADWQMIAPLGKVTMFMGDPDVGKSMVAIDCVAKATQDHDAFIIDEEDENGGILKSRLKVAGADMGRIRFYDRTEHPEDFSPYKLNGLLATAPDTKLVVIDPLSNYVSEGDMPEVLKFLKSRATESGAAIVIICHLDKGSGRFAQQAAGYKHVIDNVDYAWLFRRYGRDDGFQMLPFTEETLSMSTKQGRRYTIDAVDWFDGDPSEETAYIVVNWDRDKHQYYTPCVECGQRIDIRRVGPSLMCFLCAAKAKDAQLVGVGGNGND